MDVKTFHQHCESVILVDELPPLSRLRQKVAGCYEVFGMCPEGEIVGLDCMGNVHCLKAEFRDSASWCEEDGTPCPLQAKQSDILGVIRLLRDFVVTNFSTKEGVLPEAMARKCSAEDPSVRGKSVVGDAEYADEDLGISRYLTDAEKARRRGDSTRDPDTD